MGAAGVALAAGGTGRGAGQNRSGAALSHERSVPVSVVSAPAPAQPTDDGDSGRPARPGVVAGLLLPLHIPITLLMDLQEVLPRDLYPVESEGAFGPGRRGWGPSSQQFAPASRPSRRLLAHFLSTFLGFHRHSFTSTSWAFLCFSRRLLPGFGNTC